MGSAIQGQSFGQTGSWSASSEQTVGIMWDCEYAPLLSFLYDYPAWLFVTLHDHCQRDHVLLDRSACCQKCLRLTLFVGMGIRVQDIARVPYSSVALT